MVRVWLFLLVLASSCERGRFDYSDESIETLVTELAKGNTLYGSGIGFAGELTDSYARFEELKKKATKDELVQLTEHPNPVVRCYSFWGLLYRKEENLFPILKKHLQDTARVNSQFGCLANENLLVADFYIDMYTRRNLVDEEGNFLNKAESETLDSLVLYTPNELQRLKDVLEEHKPHKNDYKRIKEIVSGGNYQGLPALARYQKLEDVELILSFKNTLFEESDYSNPVSYLFSAIENFPHNYFKEVLSEYSKEEILSIKSSKPDWEAFYVALLKYNDKFALDIVKSVLEKKENSSNLRPHLTAISKALDKHPTNENKQVIIEIWENYNYINERSFEFLREAEPDKTLELTLKYLKNFHYNRQGQEELIPNLLDFIISQGNRDKAIELIKYNLSTSTITPFRKFTEYAIKMKSDEFLEPLFYRLEKTWSKHVLFEIIDTILAFKREDLNDKIISISRKNTEVVAEYASREELESLINKRLGNLE